MNTQGSFWTAFGVRFGQQQSSVDELLEKDPVSIEDILAHDDVIQECKYMNSALIEYLSKKETLEKLIRYIITVPDEGKAAGGAAAAADTKDAAAAAGGADGKDAAADAREPPRLNKAGNPRFPYVASELFACEVVSMLEALFAHPDLLDLLLSFLVTNKPPLNPASAGYFRKVVVVLIQRKHAQLVRHIQQKHLIDHFVNHIGLYSIMELLIMIGWDDGLGQQNDVTWLYNENLIPKLIAKLDPKYEFESEVHINAARALVDIVVKCPTNKPSTLVSHMKTQGVLDQLFTYLFSGNASSFTNCLSVVIVLVQSTANLRNESLKIDGEAPKEDGAAAAAAADDKPKDAAADGKAADGKSAPAADGKAAAGAGADAKAADGKTAAASGDGKAADAKDAKAEDDGEDWSLVTPIIQLLYKNLEPLCKLCTEQPVGFFLLSNDLAEVKTQFGVLKPPLGETRLKLVELFLVACRCNYKRLNALLHKLDVIPYVMQLFYQYAWNNMLHGLVENLVQTITESEADILKRSLFFNAKFIENVIEAHKKNVEIVAKPRGFRLGYMGHLLRMCNTLVQTIQKSPSTKAIMTETGKYKDWEAFVAGALADENKTSSIILGGVRPPNPNAPQQAGGDAAGAGGEGGDQGGMLDAQSLSAIGNGQLNTSGVGSNDFHDFDSGAAGGGEGAGDARSGDNGFHSGGYDDDDDDLGASSKWSDFSQFDEQHKKHREDGKAAGGAGSPESGANGAVAGDDKDFAAFRATAATNADANDSVQTGDSPAKPAAPAAGAAAADDDFGAIAGRDKPADAAPAAAAAPAAGAAAAAAPAAAAAAGAAADAPKTAGTAKPDDWAQFTTTPNF